MRKKHWLISLLLLMMVIPAAAVLQEENLTATLRALHGELKQAVKRVQGTAASQKRMEEQHQRLVDLVKRSTELSVIMYSQEQGNTMELTHVLNSATRQYEEFNAQKIPYDDIIRQARQECSRYRRLSQALAKMPPEKEEIELSLPVIMIEDDTTEFVLDSLIMFIPSFVVGDTTMMMDSETAALRDSCLELSDQLANFYSDRIDVMNEDNQYYVETDLLLKEAYDYAQERYREVQKQVFLSGSRSYFQIIKYFDRYLSRAKMDFKAKYLNLSEEENAYSSWKGAIVWIFSFLMLVVLVLSIALANLIVRLTIRWVPFFRTPYFRENKGMIITLAGIALFIYFCMSDIMGLSDATFVDMASRLMGEFAILLGALFLSISIRMDASKRRKTIHAYFPLITLAFVVIYFRIILIPDSVLNLVFPPVVLLCTLWQTIVNIRRRTYLSSDDRTLLWISVFVMLVTTILSWKGLVMMSLLVLAWWYCQQMVLQLVVTVDIIIERYHQRHMTERQLQYRKRHPNLPLSSDKGAFIELFWFYDLLRMVVMPLAGMWSLPIAINLACGVFNLNNVAGNFFMQPLIDLPHLVSFSIFELLMVVTMFFVFRYLIYATKAFFRVFRTRAAIKKLKDPALFRDSDLNLNLANNIIALVGWGIYVIASFVILEIPTSALTIVTTGLATGIGFAMKDVLNNFFYGVQLMGGRVRVGDTIECDGIRGKVEDLSYQSTQVASEDGSIIAFTNTALFNKNFKNLTRNHQYEMINFLVGVKYGTDVEKARQVIKEALTPLLGQDKYGREIMDRKKGMAIRLKNFGDSSIDIQVLFYALVEVHYSLAASAKEAIYNAFSENGIEIPFPQRDVYIKEAPKE